MTGENAGGGDRDGRRRRKRTRGKGRARPQQGGNQKQHGRGGGGGSPGNRRKNKSSGPRISSGPSQAAGRYFTGEMNEFELFCVYHLGLDSNGVPSNKVSMKAATARFNMDPERIDKALHEFKIDRKTLSSAGFDMEMARLDVKVAPEGIDRVEVARTLFQELLDAGCGTGPVPNIPKPSASADD